MEEDEGFEADPSMKIFVGYDCFEAEKISGYWIGKIGMLGGLVLQGLLVAFLVVYVPVLFSMLAVVVKPRTIIRSKQSILSIPHHHHHLHPLPFVDHNLKLIILRP